MMATMIGLIVTICVSVEASLLIPHSLLQLRNYQVRFVANITDTLYQHSLDRYSRLLIFACVSAFLLFGVVIWLFFCPT